MINKEYYIQDNKIIKIKLHCTPNNATLKTYEFNKGTLESVSPELILHLLSNFEK